MTEAEWLACGELGAMLEFLRGNGSRRKLRLFAVACCRSVWNCLNEASQRAVVVAERAADQLASPEELDAARSAVERSIELFPGEPVYDPGYWACGEDIEESAGMCAFYSASHATDMVDYGASSFDDRAEKIRANEYSLQARILQDIFSNPFRPVSSDVAWRTPATVNVATTIYAERRFEELPILADALEDAGCTDPAILNHCRQPGEHVRGCWVLDLILDKQ